MTSNTMTLSLSLLFYVCTMATMLDFLDPVLQRMFISTGYTASFFLRNVAVIFHLARRASDVIYQHVLSSLWAYVSFIGAHLPNLSILLVNRQINKEASLSSGAAFLLKDVPAGERLTFHYLRSRAPGVLSDILTLISNSCTYRCFVCCNTFICITNRFTQ